MSGRRKRDEHRWRQDGVKGLASRVGNRPVPVECPKIGYSSKQAAKLALRSIQAYRRGGERARPQGDEHHAYRCPTCRGWHLTSQRWR